VKETIATTLKAFYTVRGYSRRRLAAELHVNPGTVAGWEAGAIPAGDLLVLMAGLFGTSPEYVLRLIEASKASAKRSVA
jgi:transcriptional regulator with XRE-family HTH domain